MVSQIGEIGFFNDVGLCPKVEKEYKRKVKSLIFATKPLITFFCFYLLVSLMKLSFVVLFREYFYGRRRMFTLKSTTRDKQQKRESLRYVLILMTKQIYPLTKSPSQCQASLQNNPSPSKVLMFLSVFQ